MLTLPVLVGVSKEKATKAIEDFANGARDSLDDILGPGGYELAVDFKFRADGIKEVVSELAKAKTGTEQFERSIKKAIPAQEGSLTRLRQQVNTLKQNRDALNQTSPKWAEYAESVRNAQAELRAAQGIQAGSLTDLRRQRDELIKLRDATSRFAPTVPGQSTQSWAQLNAQVNKLNGQINAATPGFSKFFNVLGKIATVQAGFIAVTSAIGAVTGTINAYIGRTKQVEAFNLALKNVGLTQAETTQAFREATSIANRLGAPLQQVEKSYQRMVPALRAVGASSKQTDKFIENITARTQTLGLNTEQSGRLLEAFAQVLSKGKLQAEELNQQISELDGAFRSQLADALGVTTAQLTELVEKGKITAPVFVKAVNSMANGADELRRRIENGTATIQQLQNQINNVNVGILGQIGRLIEPGIRTFLALSLAVAKFFQEFTKTELFRTFTTVFNQSAKGIEQFVTLLLRAIGAITQFLNPILGLVNSILSLGEEFGGLVGIIVNFGGALLVAKGAIASLKILDTVKTSVKDFAKETLELGKAQDFLAGKTDPSRFDKFRQSAEKVRAGLAGLAERTKKTVGSFLGLEKGFGKAAEASKKAGEAIQLSLFDNENLAAATDKTSKSLTQKGQAAVQAGQKTAQYSQQLQIAGVKTYRFAILARQATGALAGLGTAALQAGLKLKVVLADLAKAFINPLTIATFLIGGLVENFQVAGRVAQEVESKFSGAFEPLESELARIEQASKAVPEDLEKTTEGLEESSDQAKTAGQAWTAAGIGLGVLSVGLAIVTGGTSLAVQGLIAAGVAAYGASEAFKKSNEELKKSALGRSILDQAEKFDKKFGSVEARIKGLGGEIGKTDFSNFAKGSVNLTELSKSYGAAEASAKEYISAQKELLKEARAKNNKAEVARLEAEIPLREELLRQTTASREAASAEVAARIAAGDAATAQAASLEQLTDAQQRANDAIDVSKIEAQTKALQQYGDLQRQRGQLDAANLAIEKSASAETLKQAQLQLDALQARVDKGEELNEKEKKYARDLTKTIAQENKKQVEIQQQLNDAIIKGFEDGVKKAREVAGVYGQVASQQKSIFDGISSGVSSGLSSALSLVDAAAATELQGLEEGSARRRQILQEQLRAALLVNRTENQIAQFKLAVQNRIAQNEARTAQLRFQTEARIAAARGDFDLAKAYTDAAAAQGGIIQGLQQQYNLESQALDIQKQVKDQQLAQQAIQNGAYKNWEEIAYATGIQKVNLSDATSLLSQLAGNAGKLVGSYGRAATEASDFQTSVEETQEKAGELEAARVADAFNNAANSVSVMNKELAKSKDPVFAFVDAMVEAHRVVSRVADEAQRLDGIVSGSPAGRTMAVGRATGGPVAAGTQYLINDGGGREGFLNKFGNFSMLPAGRNLNWTASTSGTVIPAHLVDQYKKSSEINRLANAIGGSVSGGSASVNRISSTIDSGNLIQRVASAMNSSGGTQRITNNVTIQSQEPVTDASKIMTNVARMKLRNGRRI